jgi:Mat/Ecp fimbriae major subunit
MNSNIRKSIIILSLALVVFAFSRVAMATSEDFNADADVAAVIDITQVAGKSLDFGLVATTGVDGTISSNLLTPNISPDGSILRIIAGHDAEFTVAGESGKTATVSVDASTTIDDGNSHTMLVGLSRDGTGNVTLPVLEATPIKITGTLHVGASQAPGSYTGTYTLTVTYVNI